ncbi:MAG: MFS transporter [Micrococcales bacterium 73-13]|nr:MAG: MFS transporter [Micrococcales bacterium 73-13]
MTDADGEDAVPTPPPTANTGAVGAMGRGATPEAAPRKAVVSWAFWDWATQPFNSVILTFVWASLYLVSWHFLPEDVAASGVVGVDATGDPIRMSCDTAANTATEYCRSLADLSSGYGWATTAAGILILLLAPVLGQRADATGRKKRWLFVFTMLLALAQFALFFTFEDPAYFWFGAIVLALGAVISEIAGVNYNAMLAEVSTPKTIGRISGLGWGLGYIGGIVALGIVVVLSQFDLLPAEDGLGYRLIAVGAAVWTLVFSIPIWRNVPEGAPHGDQTRVGFLRSYAILVQDLARLFRDHRPTFWFLLASAVYRDGLAGVFAFGGVLAAVAFGFPPTEVMLFGIAANVVAGISTIVAGRFDDRFGGRAVIIFSLSGLVVMGVVMFALAGQGRIVFWVSGLLLSAFVGPAQAASRSLLARVTPAGMQGEIFGLYATTGRVASFIAPLMWSTFIAIAASTIWGVLGITLVLLVGLVLLLLVRLPRHERL